MVLQQPLAGVEVGPHQHAVPVELPRDQAVADVPPGQLGRALLAHVVVVRQQVPHVLDPHVTTLTHVAARLA